MAQPTSPFHQLLPLWGLRKNPSRNKKNSNNHNNHSTKQLSRNFLVKFLWISELGGLLPQTKEKHQILTAHLHRAQTQGSHREDYDNAPGIGRVGLLNPKFRKIQCRRTSQRLSNTTKNIQNYEKVVKNVGPYHVCHPLHQKNNPRALRLVSLQLQKQDYHDHLGPRCLWCPNSGCKLAHIADGEVDVVFPKTDQLSTIHFRLIHPSPLKKSLHLNPKRTHKIAGILRLSESYIMLYVVIFHETWDQFSIFHHIGILFIDNQTGKMRVRSAARTASCQQSSKMTSSCAFATDKKQRNYCCLNKHIYHFKYPPVNISNM